VIERSVVRETEARTMSSVLANRGPVQRLVLVALAVLVAAAGLTIAGHLTSTTSRPASDGFR
jgi:hypothetical protein